MSVLNRLGSYEVGYNGFFIGFSMEEFDDLASFIDAAGRAAVKDNPKLSLLHLSHAPSKDVYVVTLNKDNRAFYWLLKALATVDSLISGVSSNGVVDKTMLIIARGKSSWFEGISPEEVTDLVKSAVRKYSVISYTPFPRGSGKDFFNYQLQKPGLAVGNDKKSRPKMTGFSTHFF